MFDWLTPEQRKKMEEEVAAKQERDAVPVTWEQLPDGTWKASKLGCVGIGPSRYEAHADLQRKVDLAHGWLQTEAMREAYDRRADETKELNRRLGELFG